MKKPDVQESSNKLEQGVEPENEIRMAPVSGSSSKKIFLNIGGPDQKNY